MKNARQGSLLACYAPLHMLLPSVEPPPPHIPNSHLTVETRHPYLLTFIDYFDNSLGEEFSLTYRSSLNIKYSEKDAFLLLIFRYDLLHDGTAVRSLPNFPSCIFFFSHNDHEVEWCDVLVKHVIVWCQSDWPHTNCPPQPLIFPPLNSLHSLLTSSPISPPQCHVSPRQYFEVMTG